MYGLTQTSAPATEPLTASELRDWCRVSGTASDTILAALGAAARGLCERRLGRQFVTASYRLSLPGFPWPGGWQSLENPAIYPDPHTIRLPRAPLVSVESITYYDLGNNLLTLSTGVYDVDVSQDPGTVSLGMNQVWPVTRLRPGAVLIAFTAGHGAAAAVPEEIKLAIRLAVAFWLENRGEALEAAPTQLPAAVQALLDSQWNGCLEYGLP